MTTDVSTSGTVHNEEFAYADTIRIQTFGFWIYLMSDLIIFATLFATFAVEVATLPTARREGIV